MAAPIKNYKVGTVQIAKFENEYQGQATYSYKAQRSYKDKDGKWTYTDFFTLASLRDLCFCAMKVALDVEDVPATKPNSQESSEYNPF